MARRKLRVAFVTPEMAPYAKSGELADIAASLPKVLAARGAEVALFMPLYRQPGVEQLSRVPILQDLAVPLGREKVRAAVWRAELGWADLFLVDCPRYFHREHIYGPAKGAYLDNDERFAFFGRAVIEFLARTRRAPDVIHCNNWPSALIPVLLRTRYATRALFQATAAVLTLHNVAYQGEFPADSMSLAGLTWNDFASCRLAFDGKFNFLRAGVLFADAVNTVSRQYRKEILAGEQGPGLADILKSQDITLHAIRNGIDTEEWDPAADPFIAANFGPAAPEGKKECRRDLLKEFGLSLPEATPLVGISSYLTRHKGFDLLREAAPALARLDFGLVVQGRGDEAYEDVFRALRAGRPDRVAVRFEVSPALSHKVVAGSDMLLVPSLYEPCGLTQLYAFRYGTVPVVRGTGGLLETVEPVTEAPARGDGFVFEAFEPEALAECLAEAMELFARPKAWRRVMAAGFRKDFAWGPSAAKYMNLYARSLSSRRGEADVR
jgi:starch synthase